MKYTDVPRQIEMATLWVWQDGGRPVALGKVEAYQRKDGTKWLYCFTSASPGLVEAVWPDGRGSRPARPGSSGGRSPAPPPGDGRGQVRQMKDLFRRFSATTRTTC